MKSALALTLGAVALLVVGAQAAPLSTDPEGYPIAVDARGYQMQAAALDGLPAAPAAPLAALDRFMVHGQDALPDPKARCCEAVADAIAY